MSLQSFRGSAAAGGDWPAPVEILNPSGRSETVLVCEHASNHMPAEYAGLGVSAEDRQRHIAWDIGAAEVTRGLAARLDAAAFLGTYSRLLIDLNRPVDVPSSMPVLSEATPIPGNVAIADAERVRRIERIFRPFQAAIADHLTARLAAGRPTRIVAVHSFTPVYLGVPRPWHAGVLYDQAKSLGDAVLAGLAADPRLVVAANVPYVIGRTEDYTVPVHGNDRDIPAVLIEIRQDLIAAGEGVDEWVGRLAKVLAD
jgi:predicted N-formylglutamate amidohydrolase